MEDAARACAVVVWFGVSLQPLFLFWRTCIQAFYGGAYMLCAPRGVLVYVHPSMFG
jgi:hypothetical protein